MDQRMNEAVKLAIQIQSNKLRDEAQAENDEFLKTIDENMQKIIKEQVKEQVKVQVSKILPKIEQIVNEQLEAKVLTRSSNSSKTSYAVAADLSEMELKKILIEKMEGNKSIQRSNKQRNLYKALVEAHKSDKIFLDTYEDTVTLKRRRDDDADKDEEPSAGSDRGSKRRREGKKPESASAPKKKATRSAGKSTQESKSQQTSESESATTEEPMQTTFEMEELSHPEFETDFFAFLMNRLKVNTLTLKLLAGPTYELMKGSCKSLVELKFFLEEVYKATTDQLDWVNPEGQQYPHNLLKLLPLIPNSRGRHVIPFDHFINNDLEYLRGDASSHKYTTSVTKTKAADYGHIKWIEDLVPRTMWIQEPVGYNKHALWGISHWGRKRFCCQPGITVRRDDDRLYKFKEGDFKRLHIQDIEDMLLLLVQGKLTNLIVKERFAFNVSLRMFTRSIVIQRHVEDLQLGVESYQKKLNLTRPDTYRFDLKRKEAYNAYSNLRGFIYQNKDKKNRLMRIDKLHKFSDGTLTDVRTTLDDRLKGIRMKYLPKSIWRKSDKDRAAAMIHAIDKMLKTRRIMRSLESRIVSDKGNDQGLENQSNTFGDESSRSSNVIPNSSDMCDNDIETDQNAKDERATLSNLVVNLKLDIDENKMIQKKLKKANASLTQELKECKSTLAKTSRTLEESNSIRDSCLVTLQSKQTEFERYKAFNDHTVDYDKLKLYVSHDSTKPVTLHSWPQFRKSSFAKPYDVNAPGPSRNSTKHVSFQTPREYIGLNDMVHNYYLEEAKKKIPIGPRFSPNNSSIVYLKTTPPRSGLTWKPTGRIFTEVGLKWIPIIKSVETRYNTNNSASPLGKETHNPKTVIYANSSSFSADVLVSLTGCLDVEPLVDFELFDIFYLLHFSPPSGGASSPLCSS
nr:hypothetical protein [Tanacetum cinerariifolium]